MGSEARNHHYIPQGYLRGFATCRGEKKRQWTTHVSDFKQLRAFDVNVKSVCSQRDFNRVEIPGTDPNVIESRMAEFESKAIEAVRRVAKSGVFEGEDAILTLNLMALLAVRSPEGREGMRAFHERVKRMLLAHITASKETWDAATGTSTELEYEKARDFSERGEFTVAVAREQHLRTEIQLTEPVLASLAKRRWTVYTVDGSYGEFLTTDRPVTLSFVDPQNVPPLLRGSPGFDLVGTEIHFPLTRHSVLVGRWDQGGTAEVGNQSFVAAVNLHMLKHSYFRCFAASKNVLYHDPFTLQLYWDSHLIERYKGWISAQGGA